MIWKKKTAKAPGRSTKSRLSTGQERLYLRLVVGLVVVCLLWLLLAPGNGLVSLFNKRATLNQLQQETAQTLDDNQRLEKEMEKLLSDPRYLEEVARKEHNLLKKNEKVYDFSKKQKKSD